ncbi:uncharacterized protein M437DRAFT_46308, partial [Aureobasidium melanogenum CBS 110374]
FLKRVATTLMFQAPFLGLFMVALNLWHDDYNFDLGWNEIPVWQGCLVFGATNLCAKVSMRLTGFEGVL